MKLLVLPAEQDIAVEAAEAVNSVFDTFFVVTVTMVVDGQAKVLGERSDRVVWALAGAICDIPLVFCMLDANAEFAYPSCSPES